MKIRTRLTLRYTFVTAAVLLFCMILVYRLSEHARNETFIHNLRSEAITKAHLFFNNRVEAKTMQSIYLNNKQFINEVEVAIYTTDFKMLYHDAIQNDIIKEDRNMINSILRQKEIDFEINDYQGIGILYSSGGKEYIVTAAAYDGYGYKNMAELKRTLVLLFILCLSILFVVGYLLARLSLSPIRDIVKETEKITVSKIKHRLPVKNKNDELGELSITLNALLDRLEQSFNSQKMFVGNVSHELRTPLTCLMAELDLVLQKERSVNQYQQSIQHAFQDAKRMNELISGLINLAKADYQTDQIKMEDIRLDELLLDIRGTLLRQHPEYHVELVFGQDVEDEKSITINGNRYLLTIAMSNLIENNCKYSPDKSSFIEISSWEKWTVVRLSDNGCGMTKDEAKKMFTLFYRGEKGKSVRGYGIGMTLAQKIFEIHDSTISVHSDIGYGTTFIVEFPHL